MYMQLVQQQTAKEGFWRGLAGLDAAIYPGRQHGQANFIAGIGQPSEPAGNMFRNLMNLQGFNQQQQLFNMGMQNYQNLLDPANIEKNAAALHMTPDGYKTFVQSSGPENVGQAIAKVMEFQSGIGMNPAMIAQQRAEAARDASGQPLEWDRGDPTSFSAYQTAHQLETKQAQEFKDSAATEYHTMMPDLKKYEETTGWLKDHRDAVSYAIHHPDLTSGVGGWTANELSSLAKRSLPGLPPGVTTQDVLNASSQLQFLQKQNFAEKFSGTKNVRNLTEARNITGSATNIMDYNNSDSIINSELDRMDNSAQAMIANTMAAAGQQVPSKYKGLVDPLFINKTRSTGQPNPYYNGATYAEDQGHDQGPAPHTPVQVQSLDEVPKLQRGTPFIIPSGSHKGETGYAP
jgi:hypothetical protein